MLMELYFSSYLTNFLNVYSSLIIIGVEVGKGVSKISNSTVHGMYSDISFFSRKFGNIYQIFKCIYSYPQQFHF